MPKFKCRNFIIIFLLLILLQAKVQAFQITDNQTVDANKTWTIKFTGEVRYDDLTKQGITVTDSKSNTVSVGIQLGEDNKTIVVTAPAGGYIPGENYILNVGTKVHSNKGKTLKSKYMLHFNIKSIVLIATVEQASTAILGKTVVVASLPSNVDATKYDVSIDGKVLTYDATTKKLTLILDGTFTKDELQSKIVVNAK